MGDKLDEESKTKIADAKSKVDELLKNESATKDEFDTSAKTLQDILMEIGQKVYSQTAPQEGATPETNTTDVESTPKN